ncbi:LysR substrate-binding domain-containing protein [Asticcacaulis solisilvae]|uniref:LysR substrate-binding domain-containing protein n=1 Tax=Asticcacaulis solisilvae TaxID=1217274 RepID=UPI001AE7DB8D|nr:LysR substrate-binding domain-containing protein [Asticcacaulis solisilvae]
MLFLSLLYQQVIDVSVRFGKAAVTVADMAGHLQIVISDPTTWSEGSDYGVLSPETWRVQSQAAKHALIVEGVGWGRLPLWLIEADLAAGRLVRLDAPALGAGGESMLTAYLAHRGDYAPGPAARIISDVLRSAATSPPRRSGPVP